MLDLNSIFFFKNIIYSEQFVRKSFPEHIGLLFKLKKIDFFIVLSHLKNCDDNSILNSFLIINFLTKGYARPFIKKIYVTKSKTYFVVIKASLRKKRMFEFFSYFVKSFLKLSVSDKKVSFKCYLNKKNQNLIFFIKNIQMFSEISEHFLVWKFGLYINFIFENSYNIKLVRFFKNLGFFRNEIFKNKR